MPKEKYSCPKCNKIILFDRRNTILRYCSCGFSGSKKDYDIVLQPIKQSYDFWHRKETEGTYQF